MVKRPTEYVLGELLSLDPYIFKQSLFHFTVEQNNIQFLISEDRISVL